MNRGIIHAISQKCELCGGRAMYQEWIEPNMGGEYKRYGVIFCQDCDHQTKIHSERTPNETINECLHEWKLRNESIKKFNIKPSKMNKPKKNAVKSL